MSVQRKNIREALRLLLLSETDAGTDVYANRVRSVWQNDELPAILIQTEDETIEVWGDSPREYERVMSVEIKINAEADDACDDVLDIIGAQVESRLSIDHTLGELCRDVVLRSAKLFLEKNGNNVIGALVLTFDITYYSRPVNDTANLPYLNRVDTEYDLVDGTSAENPTDIVDGLSAL